MKGPNTLRICLFGESLAAGFPLAPAFTPAMVLEDILKASITLREIEVLDLSMPNMGPSEQLRVCEAAAQLKPDICVFLTGNNWYYGLAFEPTASEEARAHYANRLEQEGVEGLARAFREQLTERSKVMAKALADTAHAMGALAIIAIPPCNHEWERLNPPPYGAKAQIDEWYKCFDAARAAEAKSDHRTVLKIAQTMETLDRNLTGTPQRMIARAERALGNDLAACDAAMRAIDACNWQNVTWTLPQVPSYVAAAMSEGAAQYNYTCVDLEQVFTQHTGSPWHGFRLFYDHCHLSAEGMQIAMAAISVNILGLQGQGNTVLAEQVSRAPHPTSINHASASFQIAHWISQFYPDLATGDGLIQVRRALEHSASMNPLLLDVMSDYVRLRTLECAPGLNAALPKAVRVPGVAAVLTASRLNPLFLNAILQILGERKAQELQELFEPLMLSYRRRLELGLDLSQPMFREWFWERTPTAWYDPQERQGSPIYRALWPESPFCLLVDGTEDLRMDLVLRSENRGANVLVEVNGASFATCKIADQDWNRFAIPLSKTLLRRGINTIKLTWPELAVNHTQSIKEAVHRLSLGGNAELFPIFGEVFSLKVYI